MEKPQQVDISRILSSLNGYENRYTGQKHDQDQQQRLPESIDPEHLVLCKLIGFRGSSIVCKGSYHGQNVALKILDYGNTEITEDSLENMRNCFKNEISLWHNLDHPNITKMIGATMSNTRNKFCIVSEYLKGGSLLDYLKKNQNKKPKMKTVISFALDIARGLSYLHSKKIIHLDIKPGNMFIDKDKTIKLADFGKCVFEGELFMLTTKIGTLGYMAPEVFCKKAYGYKSDVFSFGICLWMLYTCNLTYAQNLDNNITEDIYKDMRPCIPVNCPRSLARLMEKCWDREWKNRPNMTSIVAELEEIGKSNGFETMLEDKKKSSKLFQFLQGLRIGSMTTRK